MEGEEREEGVLANSKVRNCKEEKDAGLFQGCLFDFLLYLRGAGT